MDGGVGFDEPELSWSTQDIEQKIGFSGGRYTDTNAFFTFLVGLILSTLFFLALEFVIGDSGTAAEWKEQNTEMVTLRMEPRRSKFVIFLFMLPLPISSLTVG